MSSGETNRNHGSVNFFLSAAYIGSVSQHPLRSYLSTIGLHRCISHLPISLMYVVIEFVSLENSSTNFCWRSFEIQCIPVHLQHVRKKTSLLVIEGYNT